MNILEFYYHVNMAIWTLGEVIFLWLKQINFIDYLGVISVPIAGIISILFKTKGA